MQKRHVLSFKVTERALARAFARAATRHGGAGARGSAAAVRALPAEWHTFAAGALAGYVVMCSEKANASLKRQLAGEEDVVSLCDGEAPLPAKESSALRDAHDKQQTAVLRRVKEEKADAEGARDRNDAVAAAASTAAATAAADAREAAREAAQELVDVHEDFVNPLTLTVDALQTKIDELHALASQVDPVAADAIKNRPN